MSKLAETIYFLNDSQRQSIYVEGHLELLVSNPHKWV